MAGVVRTIAVAVAVSLAALAPAWAQDADLKKEVETLKKKVAALETENPSAAKAGLPVSISDDKPAVPESTGILDDLNKWIKDVKLSGFVDVSYTYNFGRPDNKLNGNTGLTPPYAAKPAITGSAIRAFDKESNAFSLQNAQLMLEKVADSKSIAGFRMRISTGKDADNISSNGSTSGDNFDIEEGYVQVLAPLGRGINIIAGKYATLAGYEVIESKDDLNFSRSLLFFYAIPFTHTGIRATYNVIDQIDVTFGINNGCDQLTDNNDSKTLELSTTIKPNDKLKFVGNLYYGSEKTTQGRTVVTGTPPVAGPGTPGDKRLTFDLVAEAKVEKLTAALNWDYGMEQDVIAAGTGFDNAKWTGLAGYVKYQVTDLYSPGLRIEYFRDSDGYRTGTKQTLKEVTFTNQFDINSNLIFRLELRLDKSNEDIFLKQDDSKSSQFTFGAEAIVYF